MDIKEFKGMLKYILQEYSFVKKGERYYRENEEVIVVIGVQKSRFDDIYYMNIGIYLKDDSTTDMAPLKDYECDIITRFIQKSGNTVTDNISLTNISIEDFKKNIDDNFRGLEQIFTEGLRKYLEDNPIYMKMASIKIKKYLGIAVL